MCARVNTRTPRNPIGVWAGDAAVAAGPMRDATVWADPGTVLVELDVRVDPQVQA